MRRSIVVAVLTALVATTGLGAGPSTEQNPIVGSVFTYTVAAGDTLASLGCRFGVTPRTLAWLNDRRPAAPLRPGERIRIDNRHIRPVIDAILVISVAQRMLFYQGEGADAVRSYPIAIGEGKQPTPLGRFIVTATEGHNGGSGPPAPLIQLSLGFSIEEAADATSVYRPSATGNIQMHRADLLDLHSRMKVGMAGVSVYEPVLAAVVGGRVFVEVHEDPYGLSRAPMGLLAAQLFALEVRERVNWPMVEDTFTRKDGIAVDVTKVAWE